MRTSGCIHDGWLVLSDKSGLFDQDYLYHFLSSDNAYRQFDQFASGSIVRNLNIDAAKRVKVFLPSISEQKRIVAILDEAFEGIDTAVVNTEKNLANARELFDSYLQYAFRDQEGWEERTLQQASRMFGRGKSRHRPRNDPSLYNGPYPFIQTGEVRNCNHVILESSQTYNESGLAQSKLWPRGTICITIAANIAETGILGFDACFPDSIIGMMPDENKTTSDFVEYLLQATKAQLKAQGKGSAQDNINMATFENRGFLFPTLPRQKEIGDALNALSGRVQQLETVFERKLVRLAELRQSILCRAFAGELAAHPDKILPEAAE